MGYRAGTENVPAIVGFGEASRIAASEMAEKVERLTALGQRLWKGIEKVRSITCISPATRSRGSPATSASG